jgi:hypothetical protein
MTGRSDGDAGADADADASDKYRRLSEETAHRVIRFVRACKAVSPDELRQML